MCRRKLRSHLLDKCRQQGVRFLAGEVVKIANEPDAQASQISLTDGTVIQARCGFACTMPDLRTLKGTLLYSKKQHRHESETMIPLLATRLVTLAAGAAAGKFMRFEMDAPTMAAQTAYGLEAEVEGYDDAYDATSMLFMDFRRHHTGIWNDAAHR